MGRKSKPIAPKEPTGEHRETIFAGENQEGEVL